MTNLLQIETCKLCPIEDSLKEKCSKLEFGQRTKYSKNCLYENALIEEEEKKYIKKYFGEE